MKPKKNNIFEYISRDRFVPLSAMIELTYKCNFDCSFCYRAIEKRKELTKKEIFCLLDELAELSCLIIGFCGGEVFLRKDFLEIAEYTKEKGFGIIIYTNGSLINENNIEKIKSLNLIRISVGLYGATNKTYTKITKNPKAKIKVLNALKLFNKYNIPFNVGGFLSKDNYFELEKMLNMTKKICNEENLIHFYTGAMPKVNFNIKPLDYELSQENKEKLFSNRAFEKHMNKADIKMKNIHCLPGLSSVNISPYGDVYPCGWLRFPCGNIKKRSFTKIWQDSKILSTLRALLLEKPSICKKCKIGYSYCQYCPAYVFLRKYKIKDSQCLNFLTLKKGAPSYA